MVFGVILSVAVFQAKRRISRCTDVARKPKLHQSLALQMRGSIPSSYNLLFAHLTDLLKPTG
jgi:hypothetical protein